MRYMAKIFFLMWVSGSGKTTVLQESWLLDKGNFQYVQSYTTRPLREGEVHGEKYRHITKEKFEQSIADGEFLEYALVHKMYRYGSKYASLIDPLEQDISTIKEIDMYGLIDIQDNDKISWMYVTIFLDVSEQVMCERIAWRGQMDTTELQKRIASAAFEREQAQQRCDHIVNAWESLETVIKNVMNIIHSYEEE